MGMTGSRGASGQLTVGRDYDPQADLQRLADEIAVRGNVMVGTRAQRLAAEANPGFFGLRPGMIWREVFYENDDPNAAFLNDNDTTEYEWRTRAWMRTRTEWWVHKKFRDGRLRATDDQAPGRFTYIQSLVTIGNSQPGDWLIHISGRWFPADAGKSTIGYMRVLINGQPSVVGDLPYNLVHEVNLAQTIPIKDWLGGLLTIEMQLNPATATGRVWNQGTGIVAEYCGNRQNYPKYVDAGSLQIATADESTAYFDSRV